MTTKEHISNISSWLKPWHAVLLLFGIFILYTLKLGSYALISPDEARYTSIAWDMLSHHELILPTLDGVPFLDKPILYYWLQMSAIKLFGATAFAARLWPALFAMFGCWLTYWAGIKLYDKRTAILSATILATAPFYFGMAHYANMDLEVAVLISASLFCFLVWAHAQHKTRLLLLAYCFSGLAFLTKGLIGIVFPMMIIGGWILCTNAWPVLKKMRLLSGLILFLVIVLPWYFLAQKHNSYFLQYFFIDQQFHRFVGQDFNDKNPFWFYPTIILLGFFPWSLFVFQTFAQKIRTAQSRDVFLLLWIILVTVFFSIPRSKTAGYITPVFPPLALLLGHYFSQQLEQQWQKWKKISAGMLLTSLILIGVAISFAPYAKFDSALPIAAKLAPLLKPRDEVVVYQYYYYDLPFYLQRRVLVAADWTDPAILKRDNWKSELLKGMKQENSSINNPLIMPDVFWQLWNSKQRVFVVMPQLFLRDFVEKGFKNATILFKYQDSVVVINHP